MKRKKIKSSWTDYFNFSARERRGAFFLAWILIIQISVLFYLRNINTPFPKPDSKIVSFLLNHEKTAVSDSGTNILPVKSEVNNKVTLKNFDPNKPDEKEWLTLGISKKQTGVIKNYLSHGGKFRIKKDFKKMYCIPAAQYISLEPFILLPDTIIRERPVKKNFQKEIEIVDIAKADSIDLLKIKGIGPSFAARIVKYREKLGGFYSMEQLKEVWGITDSVYTGIIPFLIISDTIPFRLINLNTDTFGIFASHPYIKGKIAGLICNYRKQHKSFSSIDDLNHIPLITEENFRKLAHYVVLK